MSSWVTVEPPMAVLPTAEAEALTCPRLNTSEARVETGTRAVQAARTANVLFNSSSICSSAPAPPTVIVLIYITVGVPKARMGEPLIRALYSI